MMTYVVFTSDGEFHETDDVEEALAVIDEYGPEVVDHNLDDHEEDR